MELLQGKADAFYLTDGASNDTAYWDSGQFQIAQGGLVLFDLGYWRGRQLGYIAEQGAYFLSRYRANISLYKQVVQQDKHEKIDLIQLLDRVSDIEEHQLWIGQEKIGIRLIVEPVPEQVRKARHTRLKRESCKKGRKSNTDLRKKMCGYNLWVTNAPATILPKEKTREYYRLRWQIELMFKIWKSLLKIDKIERMNIFRFECYLYGTLIAIMFSTEIFSFLQASLLHQTEKSLELSEWKAIKIIKKKSF
ncbi:IS4 family transposase [Chondrinema litorale]|uniref:IS4 family transposase n=1 Tax=Chondrinema litorale TaxID=2994555 RepID=UPI002542CD6C|nr:IS4 family transposase [Chondrinema litorale]UZR96746.1 IS4 family transposase [Chondrinema litorale]UZR98566.1 IS4 family transposase [Chondrinema litorale]